MAEPDHSSWGPLGAALATLGATLLGLLRIREVRTIREVEAHARWQDQLLARVAQLEARDVSLEQRDEQRARELAAVRDELAHAHAENARLRWQVDDLQQTAQKAAHDAARTKRQLAEVRAENDVLRRQNRALVDEMAELRRAIEGGHSHVGRDRT